MTSHRTTFPLALLIAFLPLLPGSSATAQPFFADATAHMRAACPDIFSSRGISLADYNNDGRLDLFLASNRDPRTLLLENTGHLLYLDVTGTVLPTLSTRRRGGGPVWGDYDNDGDLDLFVPVGAWDPAQRDANMLLRNDRGMFVNAAMASGLTDVQPTDNALWLDYDRDGYLDLYTGSLGDSLARNLLYRNLGDGTFAEVTEKAGLPFQFNAGQGGSNGGMVAADVNDDGWSDLYVGVLGAPNRLFLNDRGTFVDATTGEIADAGEAFGVTAGDIDNDGDLDLFFAAGGTLTDSYRSGALMNLGSGAFTDVTASIGLEAISASRTLLGVGLGDIDNDGDLDLLAGWNPSLLFLNNGQGHYTDRSAGAGLLDRTLFTMAFGDIDLDGSLDLLGGGGGSDLPVLYRNLGSGTHWLRVELVGTASNRSAIGARLVATAGELRQTREIYGGLGFYQDEMVAHFGLGQHPLVERLEIRWPSGQVDQVVNVAADQRIRVIEGRPGYHVVEPARWASRLPDTLVAGSTVGLTAGVTPALFDPEARVTSVSADLSVLGGDAAVVMLPAADSAYSLRDCRLNVAVPNGAYVVPVVIDQQTAVGPRWTRMSQQVTVVPAAPCTVFAEGLSPNWGPVGQRGITVDIAAQDRAYAGTVSMALHVRGRWNLTLQPSTPVNPTGYRALRFALHPGDASGEELSVSVGGQRVVLWPGAAGGSAADLNDRNWQVIDVPLAAPGANRSLGSISFGGSGQGTLYLDDVRLVAVRPSTVPGTAVTEAPTAPAPRMSSLGQNYPNPFNTSTAIAFALPVAAQVELAIFDLTGQRIADLIRAPREAGTYTVTWGGRGNDGRSVASGVYVYRLAVGGESVARRLVLAR